MIFMYLDGPDMAPTPLDDDFSSFLKMNESEGGGGGSHCLCKLWCNEGLETLRLATLVDL